MKCSKMFKHLLLYHLHTDLPFQSILSTLKTRAPIDVFVFTPDEFLNAFLSDFALQNQVISLGRLA